MTWIDNHRTGVGVCHSAPSGDQRFAAGCYLSALTAAVLTRARGLRQQQQIAVQLQLEQRRRGRACLQWAGLG